jgi:hypothetical protein
MRDGRPPERWIFICDIRADGPPPAVVAKRLLKHMLRSWRIKCVGFSIDQRLYDLEQENERLRQIIEGMGKQA